MMKKRLAGVLLVLVFGLALCQGAYYADRVTVKGEAGCYTYTFAAEEPKNWSPYSSSTVTEKELLALTGTPLYELGSDESGGWQASEALCSLPEDVTAEYAKAGKTGVKEDASEGIVWRLKLREDAVWEDGTAVTTADVEATLRAYLDADGAARNLFAGGNARLYGAETYQRQGMTGVYTSGKKLAKVTGEQLYFHPDQPLRILGNISLRQYHAFYSTDYPRLFRDEDGKDLFDVLDAAGDGGFAAVDEELMRCLNRFGENLGMKADSYPYFCFYQAQDTGEAWERVGFVAEDAKSFVLILKKKTSAGRLAEALAGCYLIPAALQGEEYGTRETAYLSNGPYRIVEYLPGKRMALSRNESWFGYADGVYEGQYQTTDVVLHFDVDEEEALTLFLQGNLQGVHFNARQHAKYLNGAYTRDEADEVTWVYELWDDAASLKRTEEGNTTSAIMAYKDFRHALSLMLDRTHAPQTEEGDFDPAYWLLHEGYVIDPGTGRTYRGLSAAQKVTEKLYGTEADGYAAAYDIEKASKLLADAYRVCREDGNISDTAKVRLRFASEDGAEQTTKEIRYLQRAIDLAAVGTPLENRIVIEAETDRNRAQIRKVALFGDRMDPIGQLGNYLKPEQEKAWGMLSDYRSLSLTFAEKKLTDTYTGWYDKLANGAYRNGKLSYRGKLLAALEQAVLGSYHVIPVAQDKNHRMYAQRLNVDTGQEAYVSADEAVVRYGTYRMDDAEWAEYCMERDCELSDLYAASQGDDLEPATERLTEAAVSTEAVGTETVSPEAVKTEDALTEE